MSLVYARRDFTLEPGGWERALPALRGEAEQRARKHGGIVCGLWRGQIGLGLHEGIWVSAWPDEAALARGEDEAFAAVPGARGSRVERFAPTSRPLEPPLVGGPGVYAFRTFELAAADVARFAELSGLAWPGFEARYDARVLGLWRSLEVAPPEARMWLCTRYASLAEWERSRGGTSEPYFRERNRLIRDTRLLTAQPIEP
jgi:hypothetical protein